MEKVSSTPCVKLLTDFSGEDAAIYALPATNVGSLFVRGLNTGNVAEAETTHVLMHESVAGIGAVLMRNRGQ